MKKYSPPHHNTSPALGSPPTSFLVMIADQNDNRNSWQQGLPHNKTYIQCNRKTVYPEKMFDDWFYPREQTCFDYIMIRCNRYEKIRARKLPGKMANTAEILFPLTVYDTKVGEYHTKEDVLYVVEKYKQDRKSRAKILVIHYPTYYNFTDYFTGIR